ncbi:MAG: glycosyltransferase family 4 protein [Lentisphaeria bacterium]|jgi:glycosyltransferase involved in cell wall biosynthesis
MNATFIYDIKFFQNEGSFYCLAGDNNCTFKRYLQLFNTLSFVGLRVNQQRLKTTKLSDEFQIYGRNFYLCNRNIIHDHKVISDAIRKSEFCIIRLPSYVGIIAASECRKQQKKYCVEVVGNAFEALWYHGKFFSKIIAPIFDLLMKITVYKAGNVSYITEKYLQECYPTLGIQLGGVANVSFPAIPDQVLFDKLNRYKSLNKNTTWKIGLIASLDVNFKGHKTAILALKSLLDRKYKAELHFLGKGNPRRWERFASKLGVSDNITFNGVLPGGDAVMSWLDTIDIYIQPSLTEAHGRAIVEACSRACVTYASNVGGIGDTLTEECMFKARDHKAIASMIAKTIDDPDYCAKTATLCFERSKKFMSSIIDEKRRKILALAAEVPL